MLAERLRAKYDVYAPVNTHDTAVFSKFRFKHIEDGDKIELHYPITILPPTKYLFSPRENILEFRQGAEKPESKKSEKQRVIFGLSTVDLQGINYLDKEFLTPIRDELYAKKREQTYLFSIDHSDPEPDAVYDIHFKKIADSTYEVSTPSDFGKNIVKKNQDLFTKSKSKIKKQIQEEDSPIHHPDISEIMEKSRKDPIWDKLAEVCFGCGICTYVCPICYCFETEDKVDIQGVSKCEGCRQRRWDSCMNSDFAAISSHNFRPELKDRIYNWYHHKFVRTPKEHGMVGCVDCGRCIVYCPARINFHETLKYLIKKYG